MIDDSEFYRLWVAQRSYNEQIRFKEAHTKEEWTQTYLLGLATEIEGVLRELNWKKHRKNSGMPPNMVNLAFKFADLTKYTLSLWELWDFDPEEIMKFSNLRTEMLDLQLKQDDLPLGEGTNVLLLDLDGTIADWRGSFIKWLRERRIDPIKDDPVTTLMMDYDLELRYPEYSELKDEFERTGHYGSLLPYGDAITTVNNLVLNKKAFVIANSARPFGKYKRIWMDTWNWIKRNDIMISQLMMISESRVLNAHKLSKKANVIMFEDDPEIMIRGANCGIRVFARKHPYNQSVVHANITFVEKYTDLSVDDYFPKGD